MSFLELPIDTNDNNNNFSTTAYKNLTNKNFCTLKFKKWILLRYKSK